MTIWFLLQSIINECPSIQNFTIKNILLQNQQHLGDEKNIDLFFLKLLFYVRQFPLVLIIVFHSCSPAAQTITIIFILSCHAVKQGSYKITEKRTNLSIQTTNSRFLSLVFCTVTIVSTLSNYANESNNVSELS